MDDDYYYDQEDRDEKLVCYERSASVGYAGGSKTGTEAPSSDNDNGNSLSTNQDEVDTGEVSASANQESDYAESSFTEFNPQADEADTNTQKQTPSVTSQLGMKSEDNDVDSVATDPMVNEEVVPVAVTSDINVKTEGEETDDELPPPVYEADTNSHKPTPPVIPSQLDIKAEDDSVATDPMNNDEVIPMAVTSMNIKTEGEEADNDELRPSAVANNMNVKLEGEEDTDNELELQQVTSTSDIKMEVDTAYECDTDDEAKPLEVKSEINLKTEEVDTDDEMDAKQIEQVASSDVKKEKESAHECDTDNDDRVNNVDALSLLAGYGDDTDNDEPPTNDMHFKTKEEDTNDEMKTSALSYNRLIPSVSASKSESEEESTIVVEKMDEETKVLKWTPPSMSTDNVRYLSRKPSIKVTEELVCFTCNISKNRLDHFYKKQRSKGVNAIYKCKKCHSAANIKHKLVEGTDNDEPKPLEVTSDISHARRKRKRKRQRDLSREELKERGLLEIELECSVCKLSKNLHDDYSRKQRSKGDNAMCKECFDIQKNDIQKNQVRSKKARRRGRNRERQKQNKRRSKKAAN